MAVQFRLDARGQAGVGGGVPSATTGLGGRLAVGTPAFSTTVLLVVLVMVIVAVAHSLR